MLYPAMFNKQEGSLPGSLFFTIHLDIMSIRIRDIILGINLSAQFFKWNCKQRLVCFAYVHMLNLAIDAVFQIFNMCGKFLGPKPNKKPGRGDR